MSTSSNPLAVSGSRQRWVESRLAALSLRQQIAQLMHPCLPAAGPQRDAFLSTCAELQVGGWFQGGGMGPDELRGLVRSAEGWLVQPIISGDYETSAAIAGAPGMGSALSLAAIDDLSEASARAEDLGRSLAELGGAVGTRWTFAPVVDINYNADNPIVNTRSFGDDPQRIGTLAAAFITGAQAAGMACTMKHFPGDGMDCRDQHLVTTVNTMPIERWRETYGATFRAAMNAGVMSCMIGHIALAGWSGKVHGRYLPATLDPRIQRDLLRGELGFQGLIVSDAIGMSGMKGMVLSETERVVDNLIAGSDVVLFPNDVRAAVDAVEHAVESGRLTAHIIQDSCRRLLCLKAKVGLDGSKPMPSDADSAQALNPQRLATVCTAIAQRSVTLVRDRAQILPLGLRRGARVVCLDLPNEAFSLSGLVVAGQEDSGRDFAHFDACMQRQGITVTHVSSLETWQQAIVDADAFLIIANTRATAGRGTVRLSYTAQQLVENTRDHKPMPVIACMMGNPYVAWELSMLPTVVACYANNDAVQEHLMKALIGQAPFAGRLPVVLPNTI